MPLIIDGYNLLHVVGLLGGKVGPGGLERARLALLNFLAESLEAKEVPQTTVVFDACHAPWGAPPAIEHRGLTARFAAQYEAADDLIEELIRRDSAPRRLTVVSSDHRIQQAARRRRARYVDSDVWYAEVIRQRRRRHLAAPETAERPHAPLLEEDVNYWIRQFGGESLLEQWIEQESSPAMHAENKAAEIPANDEAKNLGQIDNPFPPGYAEDLAEEDEIQETPRRHGEHGERQLKEGKKGKREKRK